MKLKMTQTQILDAIASKVAEGPDTPTITDADCRKAEAAYCKLQHERQTKIKKAFSGFEKRLQAVLDKAGVRSTYPDTLDLRINHNGTFVSFRFAGEIREGLPELTELDAKLNIAKQEYDTLRQRYNAQRNIARRRPERESQSEVRRQVLVQLVQDDEKIQAALKVLAQGIEINL